MAHRKYGIRLAATQHETVLSCEQIDDSTKTRLRDCIERKKPLSLTRNQLECLENQLVEAYHDPPEDIKRERIERLFIKISKVLDQLDDDLYDGAATRQAFQNDADQVLQFKIRLCGSRPRIWRRFQMEDGTVGDLHDVIQFMMGWENAHMHQFEINGEMYVPEMMIDDPLFGPPWKDEDDFVLSEVLPASVDKKTKFTFRYTYDFGDDWEHEIIFEGYQPRAVEAHDPVCLGGENACPPEDIGGIWGYFEALAAICDPDHPEHEHFAEWIGDYDANHFDPQDVNAAIKKCLNRV